MPQFQAEVPYPLRDHLLALLPPGGVATPPIGVLLVIFICQSRLEGSAMQVHLDDISSSERLLRQVREEEFVDDARTRNANRALLVARWMGRHHHAAQHTLGTHRHFQAVVEAADDLTFRTLLELIGGQMQTRLDQRVIEHRVLFAASHEGEAREIGEHGPRAILPVEPKQATCWRELVRCEVASDRRECLAQFHSVASVASIAKTAEPVVTVSLR